MQTVQFSCTLPAPAYLLPGTHVQKGLKRLLVRIGETLKRLMSTSVGQWWLVWISGAQQWVLRGVEQGRQCGQFGHI
jgi:hypothetical protein